MKVLLDSKELFDIVTQGITSSKSNEIDEIIIKINFLDMLSIDKDGMIKPYGNDMLLIKKENDE